jgi:predicted aspartyl protease
MSVKSELVCRNIHCVLRSIFFCLLTLGSQVCSPVIARPNGITPAVQQNQPGFRLASDKGYVNVPFDLYGDNILIPVRVNNSQPIWLIFDSGASINVINQRTIERLGLKTKGSVNLNAGGGSVGGAFVESATVSLTGVEAFNQMIAAAPLDALAAYSGRDIQGLIGNNFIQKFVVEIDYAHRLLIFHDPHAYSLAHEPDAIRLENRGGNPFIKVELSLNGHETMTDLFEIDTGSNGIFSINRPFAETHQLLKILPKASMAEGIGGAGLGGDTKSIDARIISIRLGQYIIDKPVVHISQDTEGFGASADAGFIGTELLRRFTVILDYQSQRMLLKPNANFKEPFEVDMSGLEMRTEANNFKVIKIKHVRANFPAAEAGLREDDEIVAVNGHPAAEFDLDKLAKMFKQAGKEYQLTVRRGDKVIRARLKMKRVI